MLDFFINRLQKLKADKSGNLAENFNALDLALAGKITANSGFDLIAGYNSGNLIFNSTSTPPIVSAGLRNVTGYPVQDIANTALATTDAFGVCSQSFSDYLYCWMKVLVDKDGSFKYIPSYDSLAVGSLTDVDLHDIGGGTTISVTGGVATVYTLNTTSLATGHIVIIKDSSIGYLIGKVTSISAGVSFTVKTSASNGSYTGGTYSAKYRIATAHGSGTITGLNTDADIIKYSPSPEYNPVYNGYYRDVDGDIDITATGVWRDLGAFFIDASGNVQSDTVLTYKSGFDKNDNKIVANTHAGFDTTNGYITRYTNHVYLRGNDRTLIDTAATGTYIKMNNSRKTYIDFYMGGNASTKAGIVLNDSELAVTFSAKAALSEILSFSASDTSNGSNTGGSSSRIFEDQSTLRIHTDGIVPLSGISYLSVTD